MALREMKADEIGLPIFAFDGAPEGADAFDLASHARAREALAFGLGIREPGFNLFVLGEDRSGRMTATLAYLKESVRGRGTVGDWIYVNNFRRAHRPKPLRLPTGIGRRFRDAVDALLPRLRDAVLGALNADNIQAMVAAEADRLRQEIGGRLSALRRAAQAQGLDAVETERGIALVQHKQAAQPPDSEQVQKLLPEIEAVNRFVAERQAAFGQWRTDLLQKVAEQVVGAMLDEALGPFQSFAALGRWLTEMRADIVERIPEMLALPPDALAQAYEVLQRRYAVNLLVDHADDRDPPVVLEPNPTYETLFGRIDYRQIQGSLSTDFTLIRSGALHRANGGILVLRAEAVAADPEVWSFLKAALRDRQIRIEERHRLGGPPIAGAPRPKPIPLDIKIVMVGNPRWYYLFFAADPDFQTYFKIRAEIDGDLRAVPSDIATYVSIIRGIAKASDSPPLEDGAITRLLGMASCWADERMRLTARFELMEDLLVEAMSIARAAGKSGIDAATVADAVRRRRMRNASVEDRVHESIASGQILIDVTGEAVGQVNALTVRDVGDHAFGAPSRVTARAAIGRRGVINIERDVAMGGPIQQKAAMIIHGWLMGRFARTTPLSFACSVTFEQNYGGVEGDSASLAELLAILSDLAGAPLRQDLAITGSVNQRGDAQPVGGVRHKVEGFFRACLARGGLTGSQGVVVPSTNERNLILADDVVEAVRAGRFHVWSVAHIDEAVTLFTGTQAGVADGSGRYPADSVYGRVAATLEAFDARLARDSRG